MIIDAGSLSGMTDEQIRSEVQQAYKETGLAKDTTDLEDLIIEEVRALEQQKTKAVSDVDLKPTQGMANLAERGLKLREEHNRGGTEVGVARARTIKNRDQLSEKTVKRMVSFFARHRVDLRAPAAKPGHKDYPSAGVIAWMLWGGDPNDPDGAGAAWAKRKVNEMNKNKKSRLAEKVKLLTSVSRGEISGLSAIEIAKEHGFKSNGFLRAILHESKIASTSWLKPSVSVKNTGASTPAKPSERISGSDRNKPDSASGSRGGIEISKEQEETLKSKVKEHNEKHGDKEGKKVDLGMLKAVYRRGAGAFSTSHRPGMTRARWAIARVNAFLHLVRTGKPENSKYKQDNDLLPKGHPKKGGKKSMEPRTEDELGVVESIAGLPPRTRILRLLDADGDGVISFNDYLTAIFNPPDMNGDGIITPEDGQLFLEYINEYNSEPVPLTDEGAKELAEQIFDSIDSTDLFDQGFAIAAAATAGRVFNSAFDVLGDVRGRIYQSDSGSTADTRPAIPSGQGRTGQAIGSGGK